MEYKTNDFVSPTGFVAIYAKYDEESKTLSFKRSRGYLYPQDSKNYMYQSLAEEFIKDNTQQAKSIDDANKILENLNIEARFEV